MDQRWQFPCCWGAIDGCHIPIKCPPGGLQSCTEYHNFKNFYSVVLMAMVDSSYRFTWGSCGFPGNSHDSVIFMSTDLWGKIESGSYIPNVAKKLFDVEVPPIILGDSAFQLKPWLMKPYTIVTRESYSLEANNALLFYLFVHLFLVPSLLEGASNFCETHGGRYSRCRIRSENCGFMTSMS